MGDIKYTCTTVDGKNIATVTYKGANDPYSGAITIPLEVTDTESDVTYTVTGIGKNAFSSCGDLTSITIPNSVTSIGESAFNGCTGLTSITIPKSVETIEKSAFLGCTGLTGITFADGSQLTSIRDRAFYECEKLGSLGSIEIPNNVTSIGNSAFYRCKELKSITIPDSVTSIGNSAFYECKMLGSIEIPNNVTSIGINVFNGCSGLTSITIPDSVTSIGDSAFSGCTGLTSITIPNDVTIIGVRAFADCKGLTSITIPARVTDIGEYAFLNCTGLNTIIVDENNTEYSSAEGVLFDKDKTTLTAYPAGKTDVYKIPNNVTSIGANAFSGCTGLTSITIPNSVTGIGVGAFNGCEKLESITFASGSQITSIENETFSGCSALKSIEIPKSVISIGRNAFSECAIKDATTGSITGLTSITFEPDSELTSIENEAFLGCSALKSIEIPNRVTSIGDSAFSGCSNLTIAVIYGDNAQNATTLTNALPTNIKRIFFETRPEFGVEHITTDSVTLKVITGATNNSRENLKVKYRVAETDITKGWQKGTEFTGLKPNTEYIFQVGFFETDDGTTDDDDTETTPKAVYELAPVRTAKKTPSYTPPANPTIDITGKEGGTVIYDRIRHTVIITPNDDYLVKEITLNGTTVPVTEGAMVLENIYGWSRISVTFEPKPEPAFEPDKYISKLKFKANSSKTSKGNIRIKVTSVTDDNGNKIDLTELKDKGYTVKFKYYRSTKKASKYTAKVEKDADINSYINTVGKKGTKYYYKVRAMVYDADGSLVAKSDLKQCSYATRTWSK